MSSDFKAALSSLSPIAYDDVPSSDALSAFLKEAFAHAEHVLNTIPAPGAESDSSAFKPAPANSAAKATDTRVDAAEVPVPTYERDETAQKGWGKPYKMSAKDNPLGVQVFKMAAHDRHGAWFARRSMHQGLGFGKWKKAAQREFLKSLKVREGPGTGAVRGIAADRRVESKDIEGLGKLEVWQTSSAFPGPVTPRGSLTLVITSSQALSSSTSNSSDKEPRHFLVISRPTVHDDAPNRPGLVHMEYESAELIREIPLAGNDDPEANPIEWLMVTRSDPGGGIPKFMVERGTPGSVVADVAKFLDWACALTESDLAEDTGDDAEIDKHSTEDDVPKGNLNGSDNVNPSQTEQIQDAPHEEGLLSRVTGAIGGAAGAVSGYLPHLSGQPHDAAEADDSDASSVTSTSSSATFRSANDAYPTSPLGIAKSEHGGHQSSLSIDSQASSTATGTAKESQHQKELRKLYKKRADLDAKAARDREMSAKKAAEANEKESSQKAKLLERHEKERKKQEERYNREIAKIDERRIKEEKREEARRKKLEAKDELLTLKKESSEWKERCNVAEKEAELLRKQVEELQKENLAMAARLGDEDIQAVHDEVKREKPST